MRSPSLDYVQVVTEFICCFVEREDSSDLESIVLEERRGVMEVNCFGVHQRKFDEIEAGLVEVPNRSLLVNTCPSLTQTIPWMPDVFTAAPHRVPYVSGRAALP